MKNLSRYFLPTVIALTALSVSASAAFYSVFGLSKLFAGATTEVLIMATSLEVAKLVIASLLHNYWREINKLLRFYLSIAVVVLVLITSMGIYGFLSSAYQTTANKVLTIDNQILFLEQKEKFYKDDIDRYDVELDRISNNISNLSNARAVQIQIRDTSVAGGVRTTVSTSELRLAQERLTAEETNRKLVQDKRNVAVDSLQSIQTKILTIKSNNDIAAEIGPLKYIANITGASMDSVVNVLILILVFVFDPLAVSLVIAANFAFHNAILKGKQKQLLTELIESDEEDGLYDKPNEKLKNAILHFHYDSDSEDDKSDDEIRENGLEDELDDPSLKDTSEVKEEKPFNEEYTGKKDYKVDSRKISKIIQKSPSSRHVVMESGERLKVDKKQVDEESMTLRYL